MCMSRSHVNWPGMLATHAVASHIPDFLDPRFKLSSFHIHQALGFRSDGLAFAFLAFLFAISLLLSLGILASEALFCYSGI
jgi:ABC-type phosphate/phosphonate transport system permease subunit